MSNELLESLQRAKGRLLFQQQAELLLTELLGEDMPPANWRELTTGALTQVVSPAANTVIVLDGKRARRPLTPCPIVVRSTPKQSGFELSKVIWNIPASLLPHAERCVLRALAEFYGLPFGIFPSNKTIAQQTGLSKRTVQRALDRLQEAQYIAVGHSSHRRGNPDVANNGTPKRNGGRSITTVWVLNVNGILELSGTEKGDMVSPFHSGKGDIEKEKGDNGSRKGGMVTLKGDMVSPEQSSYQNKKAEERKKEGTSSSAASPYSLPSLRGLSATATRTAEQPSPERSWVRKIWKAEHSDLKGPRFALHPTSIFCSCFHRLTSRASMDCSVTSNRNSYNR